MSDFAAAPSTHIAFPNDSDEAHPREHRRKAFKAGIVSYQNHALTQDCVIRDISSGGVKLQFPKPAMIPDNFCLIIPMEGQRVECQVRWRKGNVVGAVFVGEMEQDARNARTQSLDIEYVISKKQSILRKTD
ncbi:MAG: PilZ domain-containing protein [Rhizobiaceae bacterium]